MSEPTEAQQPTVREAILSAVRSALDNYYRDPPDFDLSSGALEERLILLSAFRDLALDFVSRCNAVGERFNAYVEGRTAEEQAIAQRAEERFHAMSNELMPF